MSEYELLVEFFNAKNPNDMIGSLSQDMMDFEYFKKVRIEKAYDPMQYGNGYAMTYSIAGIDFIGFQPISDVVKWLVLVVSTSDSVMHSLSSRRRDT